MVLFSVIGSKKINLVEYMAKGLRNVSSKAQSALKGMGAKIIGMGTKVKEKFNKIFRSKRKKYIEATMEEFNEAIYLLSNEELSEDERFRLINRAKDIKDKIIGWHDEVLKQDDLTDDLRQTIQNEKVEMLKKLTEKLDKAIGIEVNGTQVKDETNTVQEINTNDEPTAKADENMQVHVVKPLVFSPRKLETVDTPKIEEEPKEETDYSKLTDEELEAKLAEFDNEYNYRAHQENGLVEHDDDLIGEMEKIKEELERRKAAKQPEEIDYSKLTDEELEAKLAEFENEYNHRAHQENGLAEHEDDFIGEMEKAKSELERRKADEDAKQSEKETIELDSEAVDFEDYTRFEDYHEFARAYANANIKLEDHAKFFTDLYGYDIRPQGVPSEDEFNVEKTKQIDKIQLDKQQEEIRNQKKTISEMKIKLGSAEEKSKDLERQYNEAKTRLEESRNDVITLTQNITDLEAEVASREANEKYLKEKVQSTTKSLTGAQDKIYNQERTISEQLDEIKKLKKQVQGLKTEVENQKLQAEARKEELTRSEARLEELMSNVQNQIKAAKDGDNDEIEAASFRNLEEQISQDVKSEKKSGPKHLKNDGSDKKKFIIIDDKELKKEQPIKDSTEKSEPIIVEEPVVTVQAENDINDELKQNEELEKAKILRGIIEKNAIDNETESVESKGITR